MTYPRIIRTAWAGVLSPVAVILDRDPAEVSAEAYGWIQRVAAWLYPEACAPSIPNPTVLLLPPNLPTAELGSGRLEIPPTLTATDRVTVRGFTHYGPGPIVTSTGERATVDISESSAVWSGSRTNPDGEQGPFMWLRVTDEYPQEDPDRPGRFLPLTAPNEATAHMTRAEVVEHHARVGRWLEDHPE